MKKLQLGEQGTWAEVVANARAQGHYAKLWNHKASPEQPAGYMYSVERDGDTGALEIYSWAPGAASGTCVGFIQGSST